MYGYDGISKQRVVATFRGRRQAIAWGDDISTEDIAPFISHPDYADVAIENIEDPEAEAGLYPSYAGRA